MFLWNYEEIKLNCGVVINPWSLVTYFTLIQHHTTVATSESVGAIEEYVYDDVGDVIRFIATTAVGKA